MNVISLDDFFLFVLNVHLYFNYHNDIYFFWMKYMFGNYTFRDNKDVPLGKPLEKSEYKILSEDGIEILQGEGKLYLGKLFFSSKYKLDYCT